MISDTFNFVCFECENSFYFTWNYNVTILDLLNLISMMYIYPTFYIHDVYKSYLISMMYIYPTLYIHDVYIYPTLYPWCIIILLNPWCISFLPYIHDVYLSYNIHDVYLSYLTSMMYIFPTLYPWCISIL